MVGNLVERGVSEVAGDALFARFARCSMLPGFASSVYGSESRLSASNMPLRTRTNTVCEFLRQRCPQRSRLCVHELPWIVLSRNGNCRIAPDGRWSIRFLLTCHRRFGIALGSLWRGRALLWATEDRNCRSVPFFLSNASQTMNETTHRRKIEVDDGNALALYSVVYD